MDAKKIEELRKEMKELDNTLCGACDGLDSMGANEDECIEIIETTFSRLMKIASEALTELEKKN